VSEPQKIIIEHRYKRTGCGCGTAFLIIILLLSIYGLWMPEKKQQVAEPRTTSLSVHAKPSPKPVKIEPVETKEAAPVEPNWNERSNYWNNVYLQKFSRPKIGQQITVYYNDGESQTGKLLEIKNDSISMEVSYGNGCATIPIKRSRIRHDIEIKLFEDAYIYEQSIIRISEERMLYEKQLREYYTREADRVKDEKAKMRMRQILAVIDTDGSVPRLVSFVKKNMNDPRSFEHVETRFVDKGTVAEFYMTYRGKNALGALVISYVKSEYDPSSDKLTVYTDR